MSSKVGAIIKNSVDWSNTDALLSGESIDKAMYRFKSQKFWMMKRNMNRQRDCIVSNPRFFKGEAIRVNLCQKIWIVKAIVSFQTPDFLKMKRYKYLYAKKFESTKRLHRFKPQNLLAMTRYNYFYYYLYLKRLYECRISVGDEGTHRFNITLKGQ